VISRTGTLHKARALSARLVGPMRNGAKRTPAACHSRLVSSRTVPKWSDRGQRFACRCSPASSSTLKARESEAEKRAKREESKAQANISPLHEHEPD